MVLHLLGLWEVRHLDFNPSDSEMGRLMIQSLYTVDTEPSGRKTTTARLVNFLKEAMDKIGPRSASVVRVSNVSTPYLFYPPCRRCTVLSNYLLQQDLGWLCYRVAWVAWKTTLYDLRAGITALTSTLYPKSGTSCCLQSERRRGIA